MCPHCGDEVLLGPDYPRICFAEAEDAVGGRPPAPSPQGLPKLASGSLRDVNEKCLNATQAPLPFLRNAILSGRVCLRPFATAVPRRTTRAVSPFARRTVFTASQMRGSFRGKTAASGRREGRLSATQELAVSIATSEPSFAPYPLVGAGGSACCGITAGVDRRTHWWTGDPRPSWHRQDARRCGDLPQGRRHRRRCAGSRAVEGGR